MPSKAICMVVSVLLGAAGALWGQTPVWEWAQGAGGAVYESAPSIASRPGGEFYVAGGFWTSAQF